MEHFPEADVDAWFRARTVGPDPRSIDELLVAKAQSGLSIAVCLPALNEAATIGPICSTIAQDLMRAGLVDELLVIDSGSEDGTPDAAARHGADVFRASELLPAAGRIGAPGKGESLWKSLSVVSSDIIVWVDSDTRNFDARFVSRLVAPFLDDPAIGFVKGFYERPLKTEAGTLPSEGARVTEIAVRPLLNLFFPKLAAIVQPLSGEYAGKVEILRELPFFTGYAVDVGLLIEIVDRHGLDVVAQADLGERVHRNRDVSALGRMSFEIMHALFNRLDDEAKLKLSEPLRERLMQFRNFEPVAYDVALEERPPIAAYL